MKKIFCHWIFLGLAFSAAAQTHNEQITVIAPYQPMVPDAYKIAVSPSTIDTSPPRRSMSYDILSRKVISSFGLENIKPAKVAGEPINKLSPLYVKAGMGNYLTGYGELFYGSLRSEKWQYGAHYKHLSSQGDFDAYYFPHDNSENRLDLFASLYAKKVRIDAELLYDRERYNAFGSQTDTSDHELLLLPEDFAKRVYSHAGGRLRFTDHLGADQPWFYQGELAFDFLHTNFSSQELSSALQWTAGRRTDIPFFEQSELGLKVEVAHHFLQEKDSLDLSRSALAVKLEPFARAHFGDHELMLGLKFNIHSAEESKLQFVPHIQADFHLIPQVFDLYIGVDGDLKYHSLQNIRRDNPFLLAAPEQYLPELTRKYYIGMQTNLSKRVDFGVMGRLVSYKNKLSFERPEGPLALSPDYRPFFRPTYWEANVLQVQADMSYRWEDKLALSAWARLNYYDQEVPYTSAFEAALDARYSLQNKIIVKTQLSYYSGMYTALLSTDPLVTADRYKIKGGIDWSLGAEYRINRYFSVFADLKNLLHQRYYRWYDYPSYRMNFLLGLTFTL